MSVIGIDIGNENSFIAVARAGGIETIANEYSQRSTPTYVAFGEKTRDLGVSAKNKQVTNLKNTLFNFKRLIGRKFRDLDIQNELQYIPYEVCELPSQELGFKVNYLGEQTIFSAQQVMAMMLTKFKEISESNLRIKVVDCVLSVPIYYTDVERRAVLDAAEIAGLNVLRLMNETTAVALAYGFYQTDLPEDKPKNVVVVDLGNSSLQVTACAFTKGKLKILGSSWNRTLGGRDFDNVLVKHFVEEFNEKYKLNIMSNKRAVMRLMQECEKLKKQMSANSVELPLNIECFMEDKDVSGRMKREVFEKLSVKILSNIEETMVKLLVDTNLKPDDIESVQIVGASTRLPAVKLLVQKVFGKEPSTTLNQDEAVARGCALQCAMVSPTFKVRDFSITDIQPYAINISWDTQKTEISQMEVFPKFHPVPYSKKLTFFRTEPFSIDAYYSLDSSDLNKDLGTFTIQNITASPTGENSTVKLKARVNIHGIFYICSATMLEKQTVNAIEQENEVQSEKNTSPKNKSKSEDAMDSDNAVAPNGEINSNEREEKAGGKQDTDKKDAESKKPKNIVKSIELPIKSNVPQLNRNELNDFIEKEGKMIMQDKMEKEKADAKNAVEEYVYEMRGKISEDLEKFISKEEGIKFRAFLEETENWLYDEGEDQQKSVYVQRLNDLKKFGDPVAFRYNEWESRPAALNEFGRTLQLVHKALQSYAAKEETYAHIEEAEMVKVGKLWEEKDKLLGQYLASVSQLKTFENPPITSVQIRQEREGFESQVKPILTKPKPKVEPPPAQENKTNEAQTTQPTADSEMKDTSDSQKTSKPEQSAGDQAPPENMETN